MSKEVVTGVREVTRALNELEPGLKKQMVREMKFIARDMNEDIKSEIRSLAPLSGMKPYPQTSNGRLTGGSGRMSWDNGLYKNSRVAPDNSLIRYRQNRSRFSKITSLVSIWVRSPAVALTGVAGKGSGIPKRSVTREYNYKDMKRRHRITTQGQTLISQVRSRYFNWFYKTAEKKLPDTEKQIKLVWEKYSARVSRRI